MQNSRAGWRRSGRDWVSGFLSVLFLLAEESQLKALVEAPGPSSARTNNFPVRTLTWSGGGANLLLNGGFESGTLLGWQVHGPDSKRVRILSRAPQGNPPGAAEPVLTGAFAAASVSSGAGPLALVQEVEIPRGTGAVLTWAECLVRSRSTGSRSEQFRVEIRALDHTVLATLFAAHEGDAPEVWVRRSADLSAFAGRKVLVAFVVTCAAKAIEVRLDDIRLEAGPRDDVEFEVHFSEGQPAVLPIVGVTREPLWTLAGLKPSTQYTWSIAEKRGGTMVPGPVWIFWTAPAGPLSTYGWTLPMAPRYPGIPFAATLEATSADGTTVPAPATMPRLAELVTAARTSSLLVSEAGLESGAVEFANVSTQAVALGNWKAFLYDATSWPAPRVTFTFPPGETLPPGRTVNLRASGEFPGVFPNFSAGGEIRWRNGAATGAVAVVLIKPDGKVADVLCAGVHDPVEITEPVVVTPAEWTGPALRLAPELTFLPVLQRFGSTDRHTEDDWVPVQAMSSGRINPGVTNRFAAGPSLTATDPPVATHFITGAWNGELRVSEVGRDVVLVAQGSAGITGVSPPFTVLAAPVLRFELPLSVTEGGARTPGRVVLDEPARSNITVRLTTDRPALLGVTSEVVILAGSRNAALELVPLQDNLLNGTRTVTITGESSGFDSECGLVRVDDDERTTITVEVPPVVGEHDESFTVRIRLGRAADGEIALTLSQLPGEEIELPRSALVHRGESEVMINGRTVDNPAIDGDRWIRIAVSVPGWDEGVGLLPIRDDENRLLRLEVPLTMDSTTAAGTYEGTVRISGTLKEPLVIVLAREPAGLLEVPATVTIPTGSTQAVFNLSPVPQATRGATLVTVIATAKDFEPGSRRLEFRDSRVHTVPLAVADLIHHRRSGNLLIAVASRDPVHANSVVEVDPEIGTILRHIEVGPDPVSVCLTDDGDFLYVGMSGDSTIRRIRLSNFEAEAAFSLEGFLPRQMVTVPGRPDLVAVNRYAPTAHDIAIYVGGVLQPGAYPIGTGWSPDFIAGPEDTAFIFMPQKQQLRLNPAGIEVVQSGSGEVVPLGWQYTDGRFYSIKGRIVDANGFVELPGIPNLDASAVLAEPSADRTYYLGTIPGGSSQLALIAADLGPRVPQDPIFVANATSFSRPVRWGTMGFAFGADDSLYLVESPIVPTGPQVDLRITSLAPSLWSSGTAGLCTLVISNAGPAVATSIQLRGELPLSLTLESIDVPSGTGYPVYKGFEARLAPLRPGETTRIALKLRPLLAGLHEISPRVGALQREAIAADNMVIQRLATAAALPPDGRDGVDLTARDLYFESGTGLLFATCPAIPGVTAVDRLAVIDPATGLIESEYATERGPGKMAASADGKYLWIAMDGENLVRRFDLQTRTFGISAPLLPPGSPPPTTTYEVFDLAAVPDQPDRVVATFLSPDVESAALLLGTNGPVGPGIPRVVSIEFIPGTSQLLGQEVFSEHFHRLEITPEGPSSVVAREHVFSGVNFKLVDGIIYTGDGRILDAGTWEQVGHFSELQPTALVLPLPAFNRAVFFANNPQVQVFDLTTRRLLGGTDAGQAYLLDGDSVVHCGGDLIALNARGNPGRIVLLRTSLIPTTPPADLRVGVAVVPDVIPSGSAGELRLTITNAGPNAAHRLSAAVPFFGLEGKIDASHGVFSIAFYEGLSGYAETLEPGGQIKASVQMQGVQPGRYAAPARVSSGSVDESMSDNFEVTAFSVIQPPPPDQTLVLELATLDLAVNAAGSRLYATIPTETPLAAAGLGVFEIVPGEGRILPPRDVGPSPTFLAVTPDGSQLWVLTDQNQRLRQIRLLDWQTVQNHGLTGTGSVTRLIAHPIRGDTVALVRASSVDLIQNGTARTLSFTDATVGPVAFSVDGARVFVIRVGEEGGSLLQAYSIEQDFGVMLAESPRQANTTSLRVTAQRVYLDNGLVHDASTLEPLPEIGLEGVPLVWPEVDRLAYLGRADPLELRVTTLDASEPPQFGRVCCTFPVEWPDKVATWGVDGVAFRNDFRVFLYTSSLIPLVVGHDFDGDGLPDAWERQHSLNPHVASDAAEDPDADGLSNRDEFRAGTSPRDAGSAVRIAGVDSTGGQLAVRAWAVTGRQYTLESAPSLAGPWVAIGAPVEGQGAELVFPVADSLSAHTKFLRLRLAR